jgi:hypothetical protein
MESLWLFERDTLIAMEMDAERVERSKANGEECKAKARDIVRAIREELRNRGER